MEPNLPLSTEGAEPQANGETFGMGDTLESGSSQAIAIKGGRNKHGKGGKKAVQVAMSPMIDDNPKQLVALATANAKRTRRPRNGPRDVRGNPKKGGGGGKGTWGKMTDVLDGKAAADSKDPNYDSGAEDEIVIAQCTPAMEENEVASIVLPIFKDYCSHGKCEEVISALDEYNYATLRHSVLASIIEYAMEYKSNVRELASLLISEMYGVCVSPDDYARAFSLLLDNLPELLLDTPDAPEALGKFMARATADDCLPPAFVQDIPGDTSEPARAALRHADMLLKMPHGMSRLDCVWGPVLGGLRPVKNLEHDMELILQEFLSCGDLIECGRCLKQLDVPHFHHEFVYLAVMIVMESNQQHIAESVCKCLRALNEEEIVTRDQLNRGFRRIFEQIDDIKLDVPYVYPVLSSFAARCRNTDIISQEVFEEVPTKTRQRFVSDSEGDTRVEHTGAQ